MADDLSNYKLQLQQVEIALLTDPENQELAKLKGDLEEVIELTQDLIKTQADEGKKSSYVESKSVPEPNKNLPDAAPEHIWKVGDECMAKWAQDKQYYNATIESISETGEVCVVFEAYQNRGTAILKELKERVTRNEVFPSNNNAKRKHPNQKEYLKKKKQKKELRMKELETERESEKNKWLAFTVKSSKKSGSTPKSIFASPDTVNGRVGVGTCGVSGKPMTEYTSGEKWKRGA